MKGSTRRNCGRCYCRLRRSLSANQRAFISTSRHRGLDLSDPNDQGQHSQQEQSAVEAQRFEEQSHLHQKHRNVIEALFFGRSAVVDPGAVVNANIVISSFQYRRK